MSHVACNKVQWKSSIVLVIDLNFKDSVSSQRLI